MNRKARDHALDAMTSASFARLRRTLPQWWDRSVASGVPGTSQCAAVTLALLRDPMSTLAPWSPATGDGLSVVERSPPAMGSPPNHDPCPAPRATQVDRAVVCPVAAALDGWNRTGSCSWGTPSLRYGEMWAAPLQRVA
jgi:hypothetical protein